jgi:HEAT repeat protein
MFRIPRIAPLLSSLLLGTGSLAGGLAGVTLAGTVLPGCADESEPSTWVKRLDDPATRVQAVSRLVQFYEDKMTKDKGDRAGAEVKPLLETIIEPMTQRCVAGEMDERTNSKLVKFLSDTRDPKAEPCFIKVLKEYKPDSTEDDLRAVSRAVAAMKLKSAAGPLMEAFTKMRASKPKAQTTYRDVYDAMVALSDPSWEAQLITLLGHAIDEKDKNSATDEMFWQQTGAVVLGNLKSANAVKPLIKLLLAPPKASAHLDAILALVKIGKPAVASTVALLKGEDKDLMEFAKGEALKAAAGDKNAEKAAATAYVGPAALILATIGREETSTPLIDAITKTDSDVAKAIMARELTKLPRSAQVVQAFQATVDKLPIALSIPNSRGGARELLLDKAADFYDASIIPWMVKSLKDMKGSEDDLAPIREAAFSGMMKIMKQDQIKLVEEVAGMKSGEGTVGKGYAKEFTAAKDLLGKCGDKVDCYLQKIGEPVTDASQFAAIKAAYMVGVLGDAGAAKKIVDMLPKMSHPAVRFASIQAVDSLLPKGDAAIAAALQKMVDDAVEKKDQEKMKLNSPLKTVIYRLNARAQ